MVCFSNHTIPLRNTLFGFGKFETSVALAIAVGNWQGLVSFSLLFKIMIEWLCLPKQRKKPTAFVCLSFLDDKSKNRFIFSYPWQVSVHDRCFIGLWNIPYCKILLDNGEMFSCFLLNRHAFQTSSWGTEEKIQIHLLLLFKAKLGCIMLKILIITR